MCRSPSGAFFGFVLGLPTGKTSLKTALAAFRLTDKRDSANVAPLMTDDIYEQALKKLRADRRSLNELEAETGIPAETLRDIKAKITKSPRLDTLRKLAKHYEAQAA